MIRTLIPGAWIEQSAIPPVETKDYTKVTFYNGNSYTTYDSNFYVGADSKEDSENHKQEPQAISSFGDGQSITTSEDSYQNILAPSTTTFNDSQLNRFYFFSITPCDIKTTSFFSLTYKSGAIIENNCSIRLVPSNLVAEDNGEKAKKIFEIASKEPTENEDDSISAEYFPLDLYCAYTQQFITQTISCDQINQQKQYYPVLVLKTLWEDFKFYDFSMIQ